MFGKKRFLCKILNRVVKGLRKCLNEGTAAGGACLVKLHGINGLVLDLDALHILTADVEDAVNLRIEKCGSIVVCNRLDLTVIQHEGCL